MNKLVENFVIHYPGGISIPFQKGYEELFLFYTTSESETKRFLSETIQRDWNVVDVGANIGMLTLLMSRLTDGKVFAFEASEENFSLLLENLGNQKNVIAKQCYVSDETKQAPGEIHYIWTQRGSVARTSGNFDFITLDDLLDGEKVDFIKIDIDGYDFEAVKGCVKTLKRCSPILLVELVDEALRLHGFFKDDVIHFLSENGYSATQILDQCNYIFVKNQ